MRPFEEGIYSVKHLEGAGAEASLTLPPSVFDLNTRTMASRALTATYAVTRVAGVAQGNPAVSEAANDTQNNSDTDVHTSPVPYTVVDAEAAHASASAEEARLDALKTKSAEVAALDASAAANSAEAEASLRRTKLTAHRALRTALSVTATLATQGEKVAAIEEAMRDNNEEWHRGRAELRRTQHWYVAFAHWLRCGGSASFHSGVAAKTDTKALKGVPSAGLRDGHGGDKKTDAVLSSGEPLQGEDALCGVSKTPAFRDKSSATSLPDRAEVDVKSRNGGGVLPRLRGALSQDNQVSSRAMKPQQQQTDMELCQCLEPGVAEVHQLVKEMHEQALLHNEMLASHVNRLDSANTQAERTASKNMKAVRRR